MYNTSTRYTSTRILAVTLLLTVSLWCCKATVAQDDAQKQTMQVVTKMLGDSVTVVYNQTHSHGLYEQKQQYDKIGAQRIQYIVIRLSDNAVVHNGTYMRGHVRWTDDTHIEELNLPGKLQGNEDTSRFKKVININSPSTKSDL